MARPRTLLDNPYPRGSKEYHRLRMAQMSPQKKREILDRELDYRRTPKGRGERLYYGARARAEKIGVEFSLTTEWVIEKLERGVCEVTGIPFDFANGRQAFGPSLDREDPEAGYTTDNVRVTLWCYNAAKGSGTDDEVLQMALALCTRKKN